MLTLIPLGPENIVIGTYCVVDNKPRMQGLDDEGLDILNEIARAIMRHLVLIEKQDHLERGEKMVKGLGRFVAGKSNLGEGLEDSSPDKVHPSNGDNSRSIDTTGTCPIFREQTEISRTPINSISMMSQTNEASSLPSGLVKTTNVEKSRPNVSRTSSSESARQESLASTRLKQLFSRASQLILEAMSLDGVVFVDACFRDSASKIASKNKYSSSVALNGFQEQIKNGNGAVPSFLIDMKSEGKGTRKALTSDLLGCKVRRRQDSSQLDDVADITLSQVTVRGLMTCYSQGRLFVLNEDGSLNADLEPEPFEICENGNIEPDRVVVAAWVAELIKSCPGARTIVFFPLRDPQRE